MIGGDHVVKDGQTIAPPRLIEPLKPSSLVLGELQEKFSLMTSVGAPLNAKPIQLGYARCVPAYSVFLLSPWVSGNNLLFVRKNDDIAWKLGHNVSIISIILVS